jgi:hypothetical protein
MQTGRVVQGLCEIPFMNDVKRCAREIINYCLLTPSILLPGIAIIIQTHIQGAAQVVMFGVETRHFDLGTKAQTENSRKRSYSF